MTQARERVTLQVALDFVDLPRAVEVAKEAVAGGCDWVEAGTPLIKAEGLQAVRELKTAFPERVVVADMKTMDAGRVEVEYAAKAGAGVVGVLGAAADSTIEDCAQAARNYGCKLIVDMIEVADAVGRAQRAQELGADYIGIHVGIDQQMRGEAPFETLRAVVEAVSIPVSVAGGINSETAAAAVAAGAAIVVVGGAIIKAPDASAATAAIRRAVDEGVSIATTLYKRVDEADIRTILEQVSTANISDAWHRQPSLPGVKPLLPGAHMCGPAVTVRTYAGDWAKPVEAIDVCTPGDVLVVDACDATPAMWGELATHSALVKGLAGIVVWGAIRDTPEIAKTGFAAFSSRVCANAGEPRGFGEIGVPIVIAGQTVRPGDWIVGDDDGVIVLPKEQAVELANRAMDVLEKENRLRGEIEGGKTLSEVAYLQKWEKGREGAGGALARLPALPPGTSPRYATGRPASAVEERAALDRPQTDDRSSAPAVRQDAHAAAAPASTGAVAATRVGRRPSLPALRTRAVRILRRPETLLSLIVALTRLPFIFAGYGVDDDAWLMVFAAKTIARTVHYEASRMPGFPVVEYGYALLPWRSPMWTNGLTVVFTIIAALMVLWLAQALKCDRPLLIAVAFAMTPIVYITSTATVDFMWALAAALAGLLLAVRRRPLASGVLLGLATGARLTSILFLAGVVAILMTGEREGRTRSALRLCLGLLPTLVIVRWPVVAKYGGRAWTVGHDWRPSLTTQVGNLTENVWGVCGLLGLAVALALLVSNVRRTGLRGRDRAELGWIAGFGAVIALELAAFVRLPIHAEYLLPIVPLVLLLVGRLGGKTAVSVLCASLIVSPFFLASASRYEVPVAHPLGPVSGLGPFRPTFEGPILIDHRMRLQRYHRAQFIAQEAATMGGNDLLLVGWHFFDAWVLADLSPDMARRVYVDADADTVRKAQLAGGTVYYLAEVAPFLQSRLGVDPDALGMVPLTTPP